MGRNLFVITKLIHILDKSAIDAHIFQSRALFLIFLLQSADEHYSLKNCTIGHF